MYGSTETNSLATRIWPSARSSSSTSTVRKFSCVGQPSGRAASWICLLVVIPHVYPPSRRGGADLRQGLQQRELWLSLGWQDIKQRYRRSTLGPLWITIATGVMAGALGLLYSVLFQLSLADFLPHVTVGLIMWGFISGCI